MTRHLRSEDLAVGDLLDGRFVLEIPAFQRDYAWRRGEAERLLDDVYGASLNARETAEPVPYFLGTMLFVPAVPAAASGQPQHCEVIDGQQRLVTLTILLAVLRDMTEGDGRARAARCISDAAEDTDAAAVSRVRVIVRAADQDYVLRTIQRPGSTRLPRGRAALAPVGEPQTRMDEVRSLFIRRLRQEAPEDRANLLAYCLDNCRALAIWAPDIDYAYQIFLAINKPGLPLTDEDVVLAEVVGPLGAEQRQRYRPILDQMARYREPRVAGRRQPKTFFSHLALAEDWGSDRMISRLRRAVARSGGPAAFAASVFGPMAQAYVATRDPAAAPGLPPDAAEHLARIGILERFCDDEWVSVAMLGLARLSDQPERMASFLAALDRFAHVLAAVRPLQSERRPSYRRIVTAIREASEMPDPAKLFALDPQQQSAALRRIALKLKDAANGFSKALLVRLDLELSGRRLEHYSALLDTSPLTVEHVLPRGKTLPRGSAWREDFGIGEERRAVAESLANLVLLETERNTDASQRDFAGKRAVFFPDETPHSLYLTEEVRGIAAWTRPVLSVRHERLMGTVKKLWQLEGAIPDLPGRTAPGTALGSSPVASPDGSVAATDEGDTVDGNGITDHLEPRADLNRKRAPVSDEFDGLHWLKAKTKRRQTAVKRKPAHKGGLRRG
ncbi:MAG: DUF262 domain-containing HNH endonuclease family protein [Hyphomicrobiaceae bacterium]|nr:DUF262 domain-containing HNH endonuclease family protein [Hyphomicrobiaceae bacterium]